METISLGVRQFYPVSGQDFTPTLKVGQRYRHPFGDKRLSSRIDILLNAMETHQSVVVNQLSDDASEKASFYNLLNNDYVELGELINYSCQIDSSLIADKDLLVLLDTSSISLVSKKKELRASNPQPGVVENNKTPGFYMHPSLVIDQQAGNLIGLGDIVLYDRPKNNLPSELKRKSRSLRSKLPLEEKESYVWPLCASQTHQQLDQAKEVTYILDQGGDKYEVLSEIRKTTKAHLLVRSKENRMATHVETGEKDRLIQLLDTQDWVGHKEVFIRSLDHYSKTKGKEIIRQARMAKLKIRFIEVELCPPKDYTGQLLEDRLSIVEVLEDASTVPKEEEPIHWRLITTHSVKDIQLAWLIVSWYQMRWFIEQLFRIFKSKGFDIEHSQFKEPDAVKRQAILGLKAASQVLQLSMARDGEHFTPIETIFSQPEEVEILTKANKKLSGKTKKTTNPHDKNSLAWAAWIIARLGGWDGYEKRRKPGPITMHRGLKRFHSIIWANNLINDP